MNKKAVDQRSKQDPIFRKKVIAFLQKEGSSLTFHKRLIPLKRNFLMEVAEEMKKQWSEFAASLRVDRIVFDTPTFKGHLY